ncbi:hypothetical protein BCR33DRAFT_792920 [Rhizoclosmatium globosum]|uniref:DDE Tnp4 domain-containing protein n=1 Tax=Rhizoclosmatium globosum TaxID=329046 RepID=A0A1Y2B455_9FUNG|nr:hypothetical protein BCR33DRAFT_792920 [Rhizoclosmatium globosum]|eukprot:ORY29613.1 hypothetical protein BCR33DRAFT_792920 [Rhizoclosmatium globosum]
MPLLSILLQMDELTSAQSSYKRSYVNQSLSEAENGSLFPVPAPLPPSKKQSRGKDKRKSRQWKDTNLYEMESEDFPRTKAKDQIAMFLYFVATGCAMRVVGQLFGYGIHTVGDSICRVSLAIISEFQEDYIKLPDVNDSAQWERIAARFSELAGLCNIGLALDGVYFACNAPGNSGDNIKKEFMNQRFLFHTSMLACDSSHLIRSFYVGWPGSVSDSTAHESSSLGNNIDILLPDHVLVVGDKIFSNSNRMITPIKNETGYVSNIADGSIILTYFNSLLTTDSSVITSACTN